MFDEIKYKLMGIDSLVSKHFEERDLIYKIGRLMLIQDSEVSIDKWNKYTNISIQKIEEYYGSWKEFRDSLFRDENAMTMVGIKRLNNIENCVKDIVEKNIYGDMIECGVWRGGSSMFIKHLIDKLDKKGGRKVFLADSFCGVPMPNEKEYPLDKDLNYYQSDYLSVTKKSVVDNFKKFKISLSNVFFLEGFFKDTLQNFNEKLSLIRLDGDLYESTIQCLDYLYPKLSIGGYIIIDDYGCINACKQAVIDYRRKNNISDKTERIDWSGIFWRKCK